jgi:hypothetical protein
MDDASVLEIPITIWAAKKSIESGRAPITQKLPFIAKTDVTSSVIRRREERELCAWRRYPTIGRDGTRESLRVEAGQSLEKRGLQKL